MSRRNNENVPAFLISAYQDYPLAWYESRLLSSSLACIVAFIAKIAEVTNNTDYNLAFRGIIALTYITGRFLDWRSTDQTIDVIEKANALLPQEYQSTEAAITLPDHPQHEDLRRWPAAIGEGLLLGFATFEPSVAIGSTIISVLATLNNHRTAARSACIIEYATLEMEK